MADYILTTYLKDSLNVREEDCRRAGNKTLEKKKGLDDTI